MTRDPLVIYEQLFTPSEGYVSACIIGDAGASWRLDLCYDLRANPTPFWSFIEFPSIRATGITTRLERDEIYGYLKAKFPENDMRQEIHDEVKRRTMELFE